MKETPIPIQLQSRVHGKGNDDPVPLVRKERVRKIAAA
jgi:hypothetical protein